MNVPSQKDLLLQFDQMQHDHPIGGIAARYVEQAIKKHPAPEDEKKKPRSTMKRRKSIRKPQTPDEMQTNTIT